ncbi:hypothetical protein BT69DRAFT_1344334 [Atractiella rhizophila]|nr:hypothetical protein BT69DRAFT_1344334 [Atractiella rhizophila]
MRPSDEYDETISFYLNCVQDQRCYGKCPGKIVLKKYNPAVLFFSWETLIEKRSGNKWELLGCTLWSPGKGHINLSVPEGVYVPTLERLMAGMKAAPQKKPNSKATVMCHNVVNASSKQKFFGSTLASLLELKGDYSTTDQGETTICGTIGDTALVIQWRFIPALQTDLAEHGIFEVYIGLHDHVNPIPLKWGLSNQALLQKVSDAAGGLGITARKLQASVTCSEIPNFKAATTTVVTDGRPLANIHPAFNNADKINYHLKKLEKKNFPAGTDLPGIVAWKMSSAALEISYIQAITTSENGDADKVICMLPELVKLLDKAKKFQVDATFKRIAGQWEEWEVTIWDPRHQQAVTIACIVGKGSTNADYYEDNFEILFSNVEQLLCRRLWFKLIDGEGIIGITSDPSTPQILGWAQ